MTDFIGIERVLRDLADEADPLIKQRLLRLANNYDDMAITKTIRNHAEERVVT
jgi:hypothetical protein